MSVASEITRIQNAKTSLKTSINAKTDSEHQITNELIDDYADFVDSISTGTHTGAYKVKDYNDMLQITTMQDGDLCYIEDTNIYPTTDVDFETCTYSFDEIKNTKYKHSLFMITDLNGHAISSDNLETHRLENVSMPINPETNKYQGNMSNSSYVFMFESNNNYLFPKYTSNNKYIYTDTSTFSDKGYLGASTDGTDLNYTSLSKVGLSLVLRGQKYEYLTNQYNNEYQGYMALFYTNAGSYLYANGSSQCPLLIYEMPQTGYLYKYVTGTGWVDISNYGTAINTDIKSGVTAYVNNELVTGVLPEVVEPASICNAGSNFNNGRFFKPQNSISGSNKSGCYLVTGELDEYNGVLYLVNWVTITTFQSWFIQNQSKVKVGMPASTIATKIGLKPNVIKSGVTILGVTGTYTGE